MQYLHSISERDTVMSVLLPTDAFDSEAERRPPSTALCPEHKASPRQAGSACAEGVLCLPIKFSEPRLHPGPQDVLSCAGDPQPCLPCTTCQTHPYPQALPPGPLGSPHGVWASTGP